MRKIAQLSEMSHTAHLIDKWEFQFIPIYVKDEIDIDQFSCLKRIHDNQYLFYSETYRHFSLGRKSENPKGTRGHKNEWVHILIPKPIYNIQDLDALIKCITP